MKKIFYSMIFALLLAGCSDDATQEQEEQLPQSDAVTFDSEIKSMDNSSGSIQWNENDHIGVYMLKHGTTSIINNSRNRQYALSGETKFIAAEQDKIYYLANEQKVDFAAYYPYQSALENFTYRVDISTQDPLHAIDLLYSSNVQNVSNGEQILSFEHKLSLLSFSVAAGDGLSTPDLEGMKVILKGINTLADFNLLNYNVANERHKLDVEAFTAADGRLSQAIIIPSTLKLGLEFVLANGIKFQWEADNATKFYIGTEYKLDVVVGASGVDITLSSIGDWGGAERAPIEGEGELVNPPVVKTYAVGEYYPDEASALGVVFEVSNGGANGKVVSFKEHKNRWGAAGKVEATDNVPLITSVDDGAAATRNLIDVRSKGGNFATDYAVFSWLYVTMNNSDVDGMWYMPAKQELMSLYATISGLSYAAIELTWLDNSAMPGFNTPAAISARTAFNAKIKAKGGDDLIAGEYWASTEANGNSPWAVKIDDGVLRNAKFKYDTYGRLRPILSF